MPGYHRAHTILLLAGCLAALLAQAVVAAPLVATAASAAAVALAAAPGGQLVITGLQLEGDSTPSSMQLQRQDVWSPDAQVVVHTAAGQSWQGPPTTRWFSGNLEGAPASSVMLAVHPSGRMVGTASRPGFSWSLTSAPAGPTAAAAGGGRLVARKVASTAGPTVAAGTRPAGPRCGNKPRIITTGQTSTSPTAATVAAVAQLASSGQLQAALAVDTDVEFCSMFGSTQDTIDYVAMLVAYLDVVYTREIGVRIRLGQLRLRPNRTATDYPAAYSSLGRVEQGLAAVTNEWNAHHQDVPRAMVMYLSGQRRVAGVGMAGDEVLCDWYKAKQSNRPSSNEAYGFLSSMEGDFSWDGINKPAGVTWDVYNFAHEVGHVFGSPHTHEYCNILGNPNTVDDCTQSEGYPYLGEWKPRCPQPNGFGFLPNCTAKPTAFGGGSGTIMGYCDELPGYISNVAMTFGLNHPCGNEPDRVVRVMKAHVARRFAAYPQCFSAVPPGPSPSPSPTPVSGGSWRDPLLFRVLPYTSGTITGWVSSSQVPMFCNDTATPLDASGRRSGPRAIKVFRWRSGSNAKGTLTVHSCGLTKRGTPTVSVRATQNTLHPLAGPWTCEGAATNGCGSQSAGVRLKVRLRPDTVYDIIAGYQGTVSPQYQLSVTAQDGTLSPWPAPLGSWSNPNEISSLPFTSGQFNAFWDNTIPTYCNDQVLRTRDSITKYTGPARVFRLWIGSNQGNRSLNINSCAGTRAGDKTNISVRSTTNRSAPLDGPWQCIGLPRTSSGCGAANNGFNVTIPLTKKTWYYIIASHTNTGGPPSLRLTVQKV